jgi:alkylation response protein AidB-like acyl-CoA dehydrogenase
MSLLHDEDVGPDDGIAPLRRELRAWLDASFTPDVRAAVGPDRPEAERHDALRRWNATLFDAGYAAVAWPAEHGGRDASPLEELAHHEEMSRAGAPGPVNAIGVANIGPAILAVGTPAQRRRHLRPLLRGDELWCQGMSEPDAGSDLASLRTAAVVERDHFVVSGHKVWTSGGDRADWCQLFVRTDPAAPRHRGISALLVDMRTPGIEAQAITTMAGDRSFSEIFLDRVRVPRDALLGDLHDGWRVATTTLGFERAGVAKLHAMLRAKLDRLVADLARAGIRPDACARQELAGLHTQVECLRLLAARAVHSAGRDQVPGPEGSLAKLLWSRVDQDLTTAATRLLGLPSLTGLWAREVCASRSMTIAGGTTEINKNIVAERVLGLPR